MCHLTKMRFCGTFLLVHHHLHLERKRTQPFYTTRRASGHNLRRSRAPFRTAITHKVYQCAKVQKLYFAALLYLCAATFTLSVSEHNPFTQPAALAAITCGEAAPPLPDRCHAHNAPMCHLTKMRFCGTFLLVHHHLHLERKRTQPFYTTRRASGHNLRRSRAPFYLAYPSITAFTRSRISFFSLSAAVVSMGRSTFARLTTGTFSAPSGTGVFSTPTTCSLSFSLA